MSDRDSSGGVRARMVRVARRPATLATMRLAVYAVYTLALLSSEALDLDREFDLGLLAIAGTLWIVLLVVFWRGMARSPDRRAFLLRNLGYPIGLLAPLLIGRDASWLLFFVLVCGYVLLLRGESSGHTFAFSFGLVVFVGVVAALTMVYLERNEDDSQFQSPSDALLWAFASLLRINYGRSLSPVTDDGRVLATVVGISAVLAASLFTAQVVSWVVGSGAGRSADRAEAAERAADQAALLERLASDVADVRTAVLRGDAGRAPATSPASGGAAGGLTVRRLADHEWPQAMDLAARCLVDAPGHVDRLGPDRVARLAVLADRLGQQPVPRSGIAVGAFAGGILVGVGTASAPGRCDLCAPADAAAGPAGEPVDGSCADALAAHQAYPAHGRIAGVVRDPVVRGSGVGSALVVALLEELVEAGGGPVLLACEAGLGPFFQRHGFQAVASASAAYDPPALVMGADLPSPRNRVPPPVVATPAPEGEGPGEGRCPA